MNHQNSTISDFRFLNPYHLNHRVQIERGLENMGTNPDVILWIFTQLDEIKDDYTTQLRLERDARIFDNNIQ